MEKKEDNLKVARMWPKHGHEGEKEKVGEEKKV